MCAALRRGLTLAAGEEAGRGGDELTFTHAVNAHDIASVKLCVHACSQFIVVAERERSAEAVRAAVEEERR